MDWSHGEVQMEVIHVSYSYQQRTVIVCVLYRRLKRSYKDHALLDCKMSKHFICNFIVGLLIGSLCQLGLQFYVLPCLRLRDHDNRDAVIRSRILMDRPMAKLSTDENLVLVGVMTAKALLESRVVPAYDTWVSSIPGKVGYVELCLLG
jgi:hypothetical protein